MQLTEMTPVSAHLKPGVDGEEAGSGVHARKNVLTVVDVFQCQLHRSALGEASTKPHRWCPGATPAPHPPGHALHMG